MIERKAVTVSGLKHEPFDEPQQGRDRLFDEEMTEVRRMKDELKQPEGVIEQTEREAKKHGVIEE